MEQATEPTTPTHAGDDTFHHAGSVAASLVDLLAPDVQPSSVRVEPNLPSGWSVTILFLSHHAAGLYEVAAHADVPVTRAVHGEEIHLEAYARVLNVDVRAAVLVTPAQAAKLEGQPEPVDEEAPAAQPTPLGSSVLAYTPAITSVEAIGGGQ